MLVCTAFYLPYWATFNYKAGAHWYTRAFFGALVSYSVVVYKSFPVSNRRQCQLLIVFGDVDVRSLWGLFMCERIMYHVFFNMHEENAGREDGMACFLFFPCISFYFF
jgi:hypothetical protein